MLPRPAPGTGRWWVIGVVAVVAATAFLSWRVLSVSGERITANTLTFQVVDDRTMTIDFEVTKPPASTVECTVQAQDLKRAVVGSTTLTIPPAAESTTRHQTTIRTTTRGFAALVHDCIRA